MSSWFSLSWERILFQIQSNPLSNEFKNWVIELPSLVIIFVFKFKVKSEEILEEFSSWRIASPWENKRHISFLEIQLVKGETKPQVPSILCANVDKIVIQHFLLKHLVYLAHHAIWNAQELFRNSSNPQKVLRHRHKHNLPSSSALPCS